MFEKFIYLTAGNFNIVEKSGATELTYGFKAGTMETFDSEGDGDETDGPVVTGEFEDGAMAFNAPANGFYHVILDKNSGNVWFTKINHWAVMGDATDLGWSSEYPMTQVTLSATEAEWQITDLTLRERGGFKFRYNDGWKITTDDFIIFANIGKGATDDEFIMGGGTFAYPEAGEGAYTVKLSWSVEEGFSYSTERTGDVEPLPEYPDALYMIGSALNTDDSDVDGTPDGWQWDLTDMPMVPSHSKPHLFWKIVWLYENESFKFAPGREWVGDFGKDGDGEDGVFDLGGENLPVPGESGYYMVVVNLDTDQVAISV